METKYQAVWEQALAERDLETIDSLIVQNRRFKLGHVSGNLNIYSDTISNPLECAFYWSLSENTHLWSAIAVTQYILNNVISKIDFLKGKKDYVHSYRSLGVYDMKFIENIKKDKEKRDSLLNDLKIERDSLQKQIAEYKNEGQSNLTLIQYCLDKGMKLNYFTASSLTDGDDRDWPVNEISVLFYFDSINNHKNYFQEDESDLPNLTTVFTTYTGYNPLDTALFKKMYSKGINKKEFMAEAYDPTAEGPDILFMNYEAEKMLFEWMPDEMFQYSGHNLLHAAIINLDLPTVQTIIRNNKDELYVKTVPKPHYTSKGLYGKNALTPLELALYQQKKIEKNVKDLPDSLSDILCLEQIKEIIAFLQQELGITVDNDLTSSVPPARPKRYWSALADDE